MSLCVLYCREFTLMRVVGLNAIERVMRRAKKQGMNGIGVDLIKSPTDGHFPGVH